MGVGLRYGSRRLVANLDLNPYFLIHNHTVFYTTEGHGCTGNRESFTPVGRGITLYVRGLLSLREKNFSEGEKRRPEIRLRFAG